MNIDNEARAILDEFQDAKRMSVIRFWRLNRRRDGRESQHPMSYDEGMAYADIRLLVFAGLMPTDHITGRDADWGKLPEWREAAAKANRPIPYLNAILITKLISDLIDAIKTKRDFVPPTSIEWQMELDPLFDIPAEDNGVHYWNLYYADKYPISTAIYRDGETIESLKRILHRGKDGLYREYRAELAELRMELDSTSNLEAA